MASRLCKHRGEGAPVHSPCDSHKLIALRLCNDGVNKRSRNGRAMVGETYSEVVRIVHWNIEGTAMVATT